MKPTTGSRINHPAACEFKGRLPENSGGLSVLNDPPRRCPKLRNDLVFSRHPARGGDTYVVKDPVRAQFFRLQEPEFFIARQLDGITPLDEVGKRAAAKFDAALEPEMLENFVATLRTHRLLESSEGSGKSSARGRRRLCGNPFFLRFSVCDPDRFFNRLIGRVQFFFTPLFMAFSAVAILGALYVIVFNWADFVGSLPQLYRLAAVPVIWVVILLVTTAHEFAHGLVCKHFGGEVHELGFLLLYLQPAMYCNVSDAWLFPEKSKRLWVSFAGPYFEFFLWALAALA
ncbi:MAG TPA: hypothetical protein VFF11_14100, partial [Candidatus Binatia bacterium]|nr:hypothetical protein [Candidatus Binatia bacterium]